jgi:ESCRT-I complex subunit TSG101
MSAIGSSGITSAALDNILSQVAYVYRVDVKQNIDELLRSMRTLEPSIAELILNNGMSSELCVLRGTIAMTYLNVVYNIPVDIFLEERFPEIPPKLYVRPTSNMQVKPGHPWVEPDGLLQLNSFFTISGHGPWSYQCSLMRFVSFVSAMFGKDPPLFTRQKAKTVAVTRQPDDEQYMANLQEALRLSTLPQEPPPSQQQAQKRLSSPQSGTGGFTLGLSDSSRPHSVAYMGSVTNPTSSANTSSNVNVADITSPFSRAKREDMERALTEKLQIAIIEELSLLQNELDGAMSDESEVERNEAAMTRQLGELNTIRDKLQTAIQDMVKKNAALDAYVAEKDSRGEADIEERLLPYDKLSAQMVKLSAEVAAIDDCMYFLELALANHANPGFQLAEFLLQTRRLARDQFVKRSHLQKISSALA